MWEALIVAGLVAAFVLVAGVAGLTVYKLWTGTGATTTGTGSGTDQRES